MKRLSVVLALVLLVGGLSLGNAQASSSIPAIHSSVLLAQAAMPAAESGFTGFIQSVFDKAVRWVSSLFGVGGSQKKEDSRVSAVTPSPVRPDAFKAPTELRPKVEAARPLVPGATASPNALHAGVPQAEQSRTADLEAADDETLMAEGSRPAANAVAPSTARPAVTGAAPTTSSPIKNALRLPGKNTKAESPSKTPATAATAKPAGKSSGSDALGLSRVPASAATAQAPTPSTTSQPRAAASQAEVIAPTTSQPAVQSPPAPTERTASETRPAPSGESRVAAATAQPMLYAQPFATPTTSRPATTETRPVTVETPVTRLVARPTTPTEVAPADREPVAAVPRFIDTILPTRPVEEPVRRETVVDERVAATETPPATERPRTEVRAEPPPEVAPSPEPAPDLRSSMFIISDGAQPLVIQVGSRTTSIIDPATTEAVVCKTSSESSLLSLGEDASGMTRGVVLNGGVILLKPADFFRKFLRQEGAPFAVDAVAKDCDFVAALPRLSAPELVIAMPRLYDTERNLIPANIVTGSGGRVLIVATDNADLKTLRGIAVREIGSTVADSQTLFKAFPERNQLPLTVRGVTVAGDLTGRISADLVLTDREGTTTTQHCEFAREGDMVCVAPPSVQR